MDLADQFVSFALPRPAKFGRENFAGDPVVKDFVDTILRSFSLDVTIYVSWECPPEVSVLSLPEGSALLRSERLDGLLVEYLRLRDVQLILEESLAQAVVTSQVYRWMCELLVGYRNPYLGLDALDLRPDLTDLELDIWNPFRDETVRSIPAIPRISLQCFSLAHELGHVGDAGETADGLSTEFDAMSVMSHLEYELRVSGVEPSVLDGYRSRCAALIDADQLVDEIRADVFGLWCVAEYVFRASDCSAETAVRHALTACQALIFVYHCKEICRLLHQIASGSLDLHDYVDRVDADRLGWVARARAIARRAGFVLSYLEGATTDVERNRNVERIDAIMMETQEQRVRLHSMITVCEQHLIEAAVRRRERDPDPDEVRRRLAARADLRSEMFFMLIAFGCSGAVDTTRYLDDLGERTHRV